MLLDKLQVHFLQQPTTSKFNRAEAIEEVLAAPLSWLGGAINTAKRISNEESLPFTVSRAQTN